MDDEPAHGRAALAGRARGGEDDAAHGQVEVGDGRDDGGVVAAELEQAAAEAGRDPRRDARPMRSEPVALTSATPRVVDQRGAAPSAPPMTSTFSSRGADFAAARAASSA